MPKIYDVNLDVYREATQEDIDRLMHVCREYVSLRNRLAINVKEIEVFADSMKKLSEKSPIN